MKNNLLSLLLVFFLGIFPFFAGGQQSLVWTDIEETGLKNNESRVIIPLKYRTVQFSDQAFQAVVEQAPPENRQNIRTSNALLDLPMPDGSFSTFRIVETPVMAKGLAAKFPQIKTWAGINIDNPSETVRLDLTPKGFHAMILSPEGAVFIDPYHRNTIDFYISYYKKDFITHKTFHCFLEDDLPSDQTRLQSKGEGNSSVGDELRTYRLAVSATGEYTGYHGGTLLGAMSAIVTTMNRVNGVYIRDFSVRMELIANNDLVVYLDPATDPFGSGSDLINNHNSLNMVIGSENYDIGHVFDLGGGGVASLASVCDNNRKGRGYTSGNPPEADPFDIDYVAHEMGHQFAGNHTFNYCQGSQGPVPTEPGSATTIMGYAGICGPDNIQPNSNDHFHAVNFDETYEFTVNGNGNSCAAITSTGNTPPVADAGDDGFFIPILTPFELEGSAVDPDGDSLTYCWENMDIGPASPPASPAGATAIFRSFAPENSAVRVFPQISDIVNNTQTIGEILPAYTRPLNFRMTVRDNYIGGGGVHSDDYLLEATGEAGPFLVTRPNAGTTWYADGCQVVEWDVANTNQMPVNSQLMDIYLSVNGGYTYPFLLASSVPNTGSAVISVPHTLGDQNRIKVKAADNVFFDISDQDFSIVNPSGPGFNLVSLPESIEACSPDEAVFDLYMCQFGGFNEPVTLSVTGNPGGTTAVFSNNILTSSDNATLTIGNTASAPSGEYTLSVLAQSATQSQTIDIELTIVGGPPGLVSLQSPPDGMLDVSRVATLNWADEPDATIYSIQISEDPDFSTILYEETDLVSMSFEPPSYLLQGNTTYYWRIKGSNTSCGQGNWSLPFSFVTEQVLCVEYISTEVPKAISPSGTPSVISRVPVFDLFQVDDINVVRLEGIHNRIEDLEFILRAPTMQEIELIPQLCEGALSFRLNLDDDSANPLSCPINDGRNYQASGDLSSFTGLNSTGFWTLIVRDLEDGEGGVLESWGLVMCQSDLVPVANVLEPGESVSIFPNPVSGQLGVKITSAKDRMLDFKVSDVLGRNLIDKTENRVTAGENETMWFNLAELPEGVYFIQFYQDEDALFFSEKISVIK